MGVIPFLLMIFEIVLMVKACKRGWKAWPALVFFLKLPAVFLVVVFFGVVMGILGYEDLPDLGWRMLGNFSWIGLQIVSLAILAWMKDHPRKPRRHDDVIDIPPENIEVLED